MQEEEEYYIIYFVIQQFQPHSLSPQCQGFVTHSYHLLAQLWLNLKRLKTEKNVASVESIATIIWTEIILIICHNLGLKHNLIREIILK